MPDHAVNGAADTAPAEPAGWFGKLACLGDFASRRLPPEFTQACDAWLSGGIEASRVRLGARWLDVYLTSPLWRYAWAPGVLDARWWFGVMMPSVDNVGRYFPLLIAQPCNEAPHRTEDLDRLERWFVQLARAALATLQPGATLEGFESELASAPAWPAPSPPLAWAQAQWTDRTHHPMPAGATLAQDLRQLGALEVLQRFQACTLWWPLRPGDGGAGLSVAVGLPAAESFAQLLEGAW